MSGPLGDPVEVGKGRRRRLLECLRAAGPLSRNDIVENTTIYEDGPWYEPIRPQSKQYDLCARDLRRLREEGSAEMCGGGRAATWVAVEWSADDPRLAAAVDLIGRSGGTEFQIRYDDEQEPIVWVAVAKFRGDRWECAGGRTPTEAALRLADECFDGSVCAHCARPAGVTDDWRAEMPLANIVCWHVFDPETAKFRRACEGETTGRAFGMDGAGNIVGRNDPCPCGSGQKWKRCHGA